MLKSLIYGGHSKGTASATSPTIDRPLYLSGVAPQMKIWEGEKLGTYLTSQIINRTTYNGLKTAGEVVIAMLVVWMAIISRETRTAFSCVGFPEGLNRNAYTDHIPTDTRTGCDVESDG